MKIEDDKLPFVYTNMYTFNKANESYIPGYPQSRPVYDIKIETPELIESLKEVINTKSIGLKPRVSNYRSISKRLLDLGCAKVRSCDIQRLSIRTYLHKPSGLMFTIESFLPLIHYKQSLFSSVGIDFLNSRIYFKYVESLPHSKILLLPSILSVDKIPQPGHRLEFFSPDILIDTQTLEFFMLDTPVSPYCFHLLKSVEHIPNSSVLKATWKDPSSHNGLMEYFK